MNRERLSTTVIVSITACIKKLNSLLPGYAYFSVDLLSLDQMLSPGWETYNPDLYLDDETVFPAFLHYHFYCEPQHLYILVLLWIHICFHGCRVVLRFRRPFRIDATISSEAWYLLFSGRTFKSSRYYCFGVCLNIQKLITMLFLGCHVLGTASIFPLRSPLKASTPRRWRETRRHGKYNTNGEHKQLTQHVWRRRRWGGKGERGWWKGIIENYLLCLFVLARGFLLWIFEILRMVSLFLAYVNNYCDIIFQFRLFSGMAFEYFSSKFTNLTFNIIRWLRIE